MVGHKEAKPVDWLPTIGGKEYAVKRMFGVHPRIWYSWFMVPSGTKMIGHTVDWLRDGSWRCSCGNFRFSTEARRNGCKHIRFLKSVLQTLGFLDTKKEV